MLSPHLIQKPTLVFSVGCLHCTYSLTSVNYCVLHTMLYVLLVGMCRTMDILYVRTIPYHQPPL